MLRMATVRALQNVTSLWIREPRNSMRLAIELELARAEDFR